MIESAGFQRKGCAKVRADAAPSAADSISHLIIDAHAFGDALCGKVQKCGVQAASQIADSRTLANVGIRGFEAHAGNEMIERGVRHYLSS